MLDGPTVSAHYNLPLTSFLAIGIADGLEAELLKRLDAMQAVIRSTPPGTSRTGMQLLHTVQPALWSHYQAAFRKYPVSDTAQDRQRFAWLTDALYARDRQGRLQTMTAGNSAVTQSLGRKTILTMHQVLDIRSGQALSPVQALQRLVQLATYQVQQWVDAVCAGEADAPERFRQLAVRQQVAALQMVSEAVRRPGHAYPELAQQRLLQALAGTPFTNLSLQAFGAVLTDALLEPLLDGAQAHLCTLDVSGCWRLTANTLVTLAERCPNLGSLRMRALNAPSDKPVTTLTAVRKPLLSFGVLTFADLRELDLGQCESLTEIHIDAPRLRRLVLDGCGKLIDVRTGSGALSEIDLRDCASLTEASLPALTSAWEQVEQVQMSGCRRLQQIAFRERFPWLADGPWNDWAVSGIDVLAQALAEHIAAMGAPPSVQGRARVRAWLRGRAPVIDALLRAINDQDQRVREAAAQALGQVGTARSEPVIDALLRAITDKDEFVQAAAARALGQVGAARPEPVIDALLRAITDKDEAVRAAAARALGQVGAARPEPVIDALLRAITDEGEAVRAAAARVLGQVGAARPEPVIDTLLRAITDKDEAVRAAAPRALGIVDAARRELVINALLRAITNNDPNVRQAAAQVLGQVTGSLAKQTMTLLLR